MQAIRWHCGSADTFEQELIMHLIAVCLIRLAMLQTSEQSQTQVARLSFARGLTETRVFFLQIGRAAALPFEPLYAGYVRLCARYRVRVKPGRSFSRNRQEYRRKARQLQPQRRARKPKPVPAQPAPGPELRCDNFLLP